VAERIKLAFATGSDDLIPTLLARMAGIYPDVPLSLVSEFPSPSAGVPWIRWYPAKDLAENTARVEAAIAGKEVVLAGIILQPNALLGDAVGGGEAVAVAIDSVQREPGPLHATATQPTGDCEALLVAHEELRTLGDAARGDDLYDGLAVASSPRVFAADCLLDGAVERGGGFSLASCAGADGHGPAGGHYRRHSVAQWPRLAGEVVRIAAAPGAGGDHCCR